MSNLGLDQILVKNSGAACQVVSYVPLVFPRMPTLGGSCVPNG